MDTLSSSFDGRSSRFSPGRAIMLLGMGHATWGAIAYRRELAEIVRSGYVDSVGDGLFNQAHARDGRAAALWFMVAAPLTVMDGYLVNAAERLGDSRSAAVAGAATTAMALAGVAAVPRSGFPLALPLGPWMIYRAAHKKRV